MWIYTVGGFLSCVAHRERPGHILVRARSLRHLTCVLDSHLPDHPFGSAADAPLSTPGHDYAARCVLTREAFEALVLAIARSVTYPNFKAAASAEPHYQDHLHSTWQDAVHRLSDSRDRRRR